MLLSKRGILIKVCLLLALTLEQHHCQDYEYGIEDDHSPVQEDEDTGHPDYSKYYSVDTSAPLIQTENQNEESGFISPLEFSGFFGPSPIEFGASGKQEVAQQVVKNPFLAQASTKFPEFNAESVYPKDYFEESQKKQQQLAQQKQEDGSFELNPGPSYISHQIPGYSSDDVETINKNKKKTSDYVDDKEYEESQAADAKFKLSDYDYPAADKVSPQPQAQGFLTQPSEATPYQKYSFQPITANSNDNQFKSKYLGSLISTAAPTFNPDYSKFETQSSEQVPSHLEGKKNCRRVKKHIDDKDLESGKMKREAMNCFVCEEPGTTAKYTSCSYSSAPEPKNEYSGKSERYSTPGGQEPDGFRYKRYSGDDYNIDPYEYIKSQSYNAEPKADSKDYEEFKYEPEHYTPDDKSYSEIQSEAITKNPANCYKEEKSGMTCTICKDAKTGGNFEQCSYTSEPKEQKYAYVTEKKYDSNEEPSEAKPLKKSGNFKPVEDYRQFETKQKLVNDDPYEVPKHFAESTENKEKKTVNYHQPEDVSEERDSADSDKVSPYKDLDEYHFKLFPEYSKQETQQAEVVAANNKNVEDTSRKDVEEVLAEFSKKDRSTCKKAEKKGMTCYLCVDKKGIQHEECMYVSESKPQASHVAYHEVKQIKSPQLDVASSNVQETVVPFVLETASSEDVEVRATKSRRRPIVKKKKEPVAAASYDKERIDDRNDPQPKTPVEFVVGAEEGAYSQETKPVYSKTLGVKLPRYMLEKTEFEKEFDEFAGN